MASGSATWDCLAADRPSAYRMQLRKRIPAICEDGRNGAIHSQTEFPILAIYSFDVDIYRYPGHFSQGGETLAKSVSLHTGEYIYLKLTPGFYLIHLKEQEGHRHILHIRSGQTSIRSIEIFNREPFSRADIRIIELDREQAAAFLITEAGRMYAHTQSEDQ